MEVAVEVDAREDEEGMEGAGRLREGELELRETGTTATETGRLPLLLLLVPRLLKELDGVAGVSVSLGGGVGGVEVHVGVKGKPALPAACAAISVGGGIAACPPKVR